MYKTILSRQCLRFLLASIAAINCVSTQILVAAQSRIIEPDVIEDVEEVFVLTQGQFGVSSLAITESTLVSSSFGDLTGGNNNLLQWNLRAKPEPTFADLDFHTGDVAAVDIDASGTRILTGSVDHDALLIDAENNERIFTLSGHQNWILSVSISDDGKRGLTGSADSTLMYWDLKTGERLRSLLGHRSGIFAVDITPDGTGAASASCGRYSENEEDSSLECIEGEIIIWDLATGEITNRFSAHGDVIFTLEYTDDGLQLLSGAADGKMILWDVESGELIRGFPSEEQPAHSSTIRSISLSPDNQLAVSGSRDGSIRIWEVATGSLLRTIEFNVRNKVVYSTAFGENYIVAGLAEGSVRIFGLPNE